MGSDFYKLMHKDSLCGTIAIDHDSGALTDFYSLPASAAPFLGHADLKRMKKWWETRAVPSSRRMMQEVIWRAGFVSTEAYLAKNLALSMTDAYWICPVDMELTWGTVNLHTAAAGADGRISWFMNRKGRRFINPPVGGHIPCGDMPSSGMNPPDVDSYLYHNATSYDPNASLGGQMDKYWDVSAAVPVLVKTAYKEFGQQSLNELFAANLHERQGSDFPYTTYTVSRTVDSGIRSECPAFTDEKKELISAMEILDSEKIPNNRSLYDAYIKICSENGIDKAYMRNFMDYQTVTDFVISNTDRHLMNYGILRDADNLRFLSPAPIFDSGNSMFYTEFRKKPFSRCEVLDRKITAIHDKEEAMLRHVQNRMIVREDLLPVKKEVEVFYAENGVPEEKAKFIAGSYETKLQLLRDFQKGRTISLYSEKQRAKASRKQ